jgi:hypothetical protein
MIRRQVAFGKIKNQTQNTRTTRPFAMATSTSGGVDESLAIGKLHVGDDPDVARSNQPLPALPQDESEHTSTTMEPASKASGGARDIKVYISASSLAHFWHKVPKEVSEHSGHQSNMPSETVPKARICAVPKSAHNRCLTHAYTATPPSRSLAASAIVPTSRCPPPCYSPCLLILPRSLLPSLHLSRSLLPSLHLPRSVLQV